MKREGVRVSPDKVIDSFSNYLDLNVVRFEAAVVGCEAGLREQDRWEGILEPHCWLLRLPRK